MTTPATLKVHGYIIQPGDKLLLSTPNVQLTQQQYEELKNKVQNFIGKEVEIMMLYGVEMMVRKNDKSNS